ncbi:hypothetical protein [Paenibacillus tianjinensis]|uniref:Uncharacterized protein n=1 Tax=Paenibacillus tianjinensis TaxID=2810347 RepID=A0ABX7L5S5_9BACL|nr:hypothetical protein [Paenibacillus tianjinensis]QSF43222.1 hypothetical protein JRJ22_18290 [Paenibacillus tianjinensis]
MSEELSRVKSRRKQNNRKDQPQLKREKARSTTLSASSQNEPVVPVPGTLSRKAKYAAASPKAAGNRQTTQEAEDTPSRSRSYPSERIRLSKIFVNSLIFMFVLLLASLVWWGIEGAPELRTLW